MTSGLRERVCEFDWARAITERWCHHPCGSVGSVLDAHQSPLQLVRNLWHKGTHLTLETYGTIVARFAGMHAALVLLLGFSWLGE